MRRAEERGLDVLGCRLRGTARRMDGGRKSNRRKGGLLRGVEQRRNVEIRMTSVELAP